MNDTSPRPSAPVKGIKYMNLQEFCQLGFLQEVNRQFFHPLGLALEVLCQDEDYAGAQLSGVCDYRDDPEGIVFIPGMIDSEKVERVQAERERHWEPRRRMFYGPVFFDHQPHPLHHADVQPQDWGDGQAGNEQAT